MCPYKGKMPRELTNILDFFLLTPTYEDGTECSETSAHKIQTPGYKDGTDRVLRNVGT